MERSLYNMTRGLIIGCCSLILKGILFTLYDVDILDIEKLYKYSTADRQGVPLISVTNHVSVLDDPCMVSLITPPRVAFGASRMRWTVCTEEICFKTPGLASFFGAAKAVPIQRGGSIYQKAIATLQHKLNAGEWVNLFAEGRVWQEVGLPLRDEHGRWCR